MKNTIPHSRPFIGPAESAAVGRVLKSGMLSGGPEVPAFENEARRLFGLRHAAAVSSGTKALELALKAMDIKEGSEVLIPSFVCSALWHAVKKTGAEPVLVDCDPSTFNPCMKDAKKKVSKRTGAIIIPHLFGLPSDIRGAKALGVPLLEDCAQAAGARVGNKPCGSFGRACAVSFYATKLVSAGTGGMVLSDSAVLTDKVADLREYDGKKPDRTRENARMGELEAALGRAQLARLAGFLKRRAKIASAYDEAFSGAGCVLPVKMKGRVYYRYVLRLPEAELSGAIRQLERAGIMAARPVFRPLHLDVPCRGGFPGADEAWKTALSIPLYPALTGAEVKRILKSVRAALK